TNSSGMTGSLGSASAFTSKPRPRSAAGRRWGERVEGGGAVPPLASRPPRVAAYAVHRRGARGQRRHRRRGVQGRLVPLSRRVPGGTGVGDGVFVTRISCH